MSEELITLPHHPYTQALLSAIPVPVPRRSKKSRIVLTGDVPNPIDPPPGCHFHPRCRFAIDKCRVGAPPAPVDVGEGHQVACHLVADGQSPPYS